MLFQCWCTWMRLDQYWSLIRSFCWFIGVCAHGSDGKFHKSRCILPNNGLIPGDLFTKVQSFVFTKKIYPSKHETLTQCCFNAGPPSTTLTKRKTALSQRLVLLGCVYTACKSWHFLLKHLRLPGNHDILTQCWYNVGPPSATLVQHCTNIGLLSRICWELFCTCIFPHVCHVTTIFCIACREFEIVIYGVIYIKHDLCNKSCSERAVSFGEAVKTWRRSKPFGKGMPWFSEDRAGSVIIARGVYWGGAPPCRAKKAVTAYLTSKQLQPFGFA